jgi:hypothetical protein
MKLKDLRGTYDSVFSLGRRCLTAIHMEENKLRSYPGVFDWMLAPELASVNYMIKHRFQGFMELQNMQVVGKTDHNYIVYDAMSHFYSYHDFSLLKNRYNQLHTYPEFKLKLNHRIERFNERLDEDSIFLFVRVQGSYRDVTELERVLSERVRGDFRILIVNEGKMDHIVEIDWGLEKTCVIEVAYTDTHPFVNDYQWSRMLEGIRIAI